LNTGFAEIQNKPAKFLRISGQEVNNISESAEEKMRENLKYCSGFVIKLMMPESVVKYLA
jgi:hypothetical protein